MKALITGVTGFVGSHLAERLLADGQEVIGLSRSGRWPLGAEYLGERVRLAAVDIADKAGLVRVLERHQPDALYHLAGQANVPEGNRHPEATWQTNFVGSRNVFEAAGAAAPRARILFASTGTVYGQPRPEDLPITEATPLNPANAYASSKAACDQLALELAADQGTHLIVARAFNHIGPRQQSSFAIAHFARQIAEQEISDAPAQLHVGRLDVQRDFTDVRDVVRAYSLLIEHAAPGEVFNVASGSTWVLRGILEQLLRLSTKAIELVQDPSLLRPKDPDVVRVSADRLRTRTGWRPIVPMEQTLADTLAYWRQYVRSPQASSRESAPAINQK